MSAEPIEPSFREALGVWAKIGCLSFGGPAAQIALMHKEIVEKRGWLSEERYLAALSFCMLLPGPEAMQLATYAGWRLHGLRGGLAAGLLFVLPGAALIMVLASIYALGQDLPWIEAMFVGIKAAVLAIVLQALLRIAKKALIGWSHWVLAFVAFACLFFTELPYPLVIAGAAIWGFVFTRQSTPASDERPAAATGASTLATVAVWLLVWWLPIGILSGTSAPDILLDIGLFFSKLAVVTFGGAYAVLAYMAQEIVTGYRWLSAGEMLDALGLAETTPGPLILVTQFTAFLAASKQGGLVLGIAAATIALWVTFAPCFLWIFAGAPFLDRIVAQPRLRGALQAITAAVVGVILNLSLWFALHVVFAIVEPVRSGMFRLWVTELGSIDPVALLLAAACGALLLKLRWPLWRILVAAAVGGVASSLIWP